MLPKRFDWKITSASDILEYTWDSNNLTVDRYKRGLVNKDLSGQPIDEKVRQEMAALIKMAYHNFGVALGLYMNEVESNHRGKFFEAKYHPAAQFSPKKQLADKVNDSIVATFNEIVKDSFCRAKRGEQHQMLNLVDNMVKIYEDDYLFGYDANDQPEMVEQCAHQTLHTISNLQRQMTKYIQYEKKLAHCIIVSDQKMLKVNRVQEHVRDLVR